MRQLYLTSLAVLIAANCLAQFGGRSSYEFLNLPAHARLAGLGGVNVSLANRDVNFLFNNPALVTDSLAGYASAGYTFFVADIGQTSFAYAHTFKKIGLLTFGVQHVNYGEIQGYDANENETGLYKSGETALVIGKSHRVSAFTLGANLKFVSSNIAGFRSQALLMDLGGTFTHPQQDLVIGMAIKNVGVVLQEYSESSDTRIPFDVQAGVTFKPEHMPLRFSLTAYNLAYPGKAYDNPADEEDDTRTIGKVLQHLNIGTEVLFHKNVHLLLGYNVLRQKELRVNNRGGGLTIGATINVKAFDLAVSRTAYSVGRAAYTFTVSANLNKMILKKRVI